MAFGAFAVGATAGLELDEPKVDSHLDFFAAVVAGDEADLKLVGLEFPTVEQVLYVLAQASGLPVGSAPRRATASQP